jgi:RimJ/RimL family protein N-acetyltransferase
MKPGAVVAPAERQRGAVNHGPPSGLSSRQNALVQLRPFAEDDLSSVEPWFDDAETMRWLGAREWPREMLELIRRPPPSSTARIGWVADEGGLAIGLADVELYHDGTAATAIVIAPGSRGQGKCVELLLMIARDLRARGTRRFVGGIHTDNPASRRCAEHAGFRAATEMPDADGFVDYVLTLTQ